MLDPNQKQCGAHADCLKLFDQDLSYACVDSFCVQQGCSNDAQCQERGTEFTAAICGADQLCQSDECSTNADCQSRGAAFAASICVERACRPEPTWGCLGSEPAPATSAGPFRVTLTVQDLVNQQPLVGVDARLCRKLDINCEAPESAVVTSGDDGVVAFDVPSGFAGYVFFTRADRTPGLYFFNPAITKDTTIASVPLGTPAIVGLLTAQTGATQSAGNGLVLLLTENCTGAPGAGVKFTIERRDELTSTFYSANLLPSSSATETDVDGYGGLINVPPGTTVVGGELSADGRPVSSVSLLVKAGAVTYSRLAPPGK